VVYSGTRPARPRTRHVFQPIVIHSAFSAYLQVGAFSGIYGGTIGRYCSIAPNVTLGRNEHAIGWVTTSMLAERPMTHDWDEFVEPGGRGRT
jgi:hypothetical protein